MNAKYKNFLLQFDGPFGGCAGIASHNSFSGEMTDRGEDSESPKPMACKHPQARQWCVVAFADGLLKMFGDDLPIPDSDEVFHLDLELTPAGREACGLPPLVAYSAPVKAEKPKKAPKPAKRQAPCFDFGDDE